MKTQKDIHWIKDLAKYSEAMKFLCLYYDEKQDLILNYATKFPFTGQINFGSNPGIVWILNGKIHHPVRPAYNVNEKIEYWLDGIQYEFKDFWMKQKDTKYAPKIMAEVLGVKENKL